MIKVVIFMLCIFYHTQKNLTQNKKERLEFELS